MAIFRCRSSATIAGTGYLVRHRIGTVAIDDDMVTIIGSDGSIQMLPVACLDVYKSHLIKDLESKLERATKIHQELSDLELDELLPHLDIDHEQLKGSRQKQHRQMTDQTERTNHTQNEQNPNEKGYLANKQYQLERQNELMRQLEQTADQKLIQNHQSQFDRNEQQQKQQLEVLVERLEK